VEEASDPKKRNREKRKGKRTSGGKKDERSRRRDLTVALGDTLSLLLLLDGIGVSGASGSVDELISEALSDALDVAEGAVADTLGHEVEGLVDTTERGDINSLTLDSASGADTGGILTRGGVDDGINEDLDGVLAGGEGDDLKSVLDDTEGHDLLARVAAVHHHAVDKTLNDGALALAEGALVVAASSVGEVHTVLVALVDSDVVLKGDVADLDVLIGPLVEKLALNFGGRHSAI